jgi:hypothetical protein
MDLKEAPFGKAEARHVWETARLGIVREMILERLPEFGRAGDSLLDVGCGDAYVLEKLAGDYPHANFLGIDSALSEQTALACNQRGQNMKVFNSIEEASQSIRHSVVLLLDVIEHVENDAGLLRNLTNGPSTSSSIYIITVPAYNFLFSKHDKFLGHFRRYSLTKLRGTVRDAGLEPVQDGYFFFSLLPVRCLQIFAEKILPGLSGKPAAVARWRGGPFDGILTALLKLDYKICRMFRRIGLVLPGLSCYAICRKQR